MISVSSLQLELEMAVPMELLSDHWPLMESLSCDAELLSVPTQADLDAIRQHDSTCTKHTSEREPLISNSGSRNQLNTLSAIDSSSFLRLVSSQKFSTEDAVCGGLPAAAGVASKVRRTPIMHRIAYNVSW